MTATDSEMMPANNIDAQEGDVIMSSPPSSPSPSSSTSSSSKKRARDDATTTDLAEFGSDSRKLSAEHAELLDNITQTHRDGAPTEELLEFYEEAYRVYLPELQVLKIQLMDIVQEIRVHKKDLKCLSDLERLVAKVQKDTAEADAKAAEVEAKSKEVEAKAQAKFDKFFATLMKQLKPEDAQLAMCSDDQRQAIVEAAQDLISRCQSSPPQTMDSVPEEPPKKKRVSTKHIYTPQEIESMNATIAKWRPLQAHARPQIDSIERFFEEVRALCLDQQDTSEAALDATTKAIAKIEKDISTTHRMNMLV